MSNPKYTPDEGNKQSPDDDPSGLSVYGSRRGFGVRGDARSVIAVVVIIAVVVLLVTFRVTEWASPAELATFTPTVLAPAEQIPAK